MVVCALNPLGNSYPGDACPQGHFAYGRLDAIDTELQKIEAASWPYASRWGNAYEAVVPYVDRYNPLLQDGGTILMSKTIRDMPTGQVVASNTRLEVFRVSFVPDP